MSKVKLQGGYFNDDEDNNLDNTPVITELKEKDEVITEEQYTTQSTNKLTIIPPKKPEPFNERLVANVTKSQKKYVQQMSKKFENESAFVRYVLDYFMANAEVK